MLGSQRRLCALALLGAAAVSCGPGGSGASSWRSAGSTVIVAADGDSLWLTSPDDNRVVHVAGASLAVSTTLDVPGEPTLLVATADTLVVTLAQSSDVAMIALSDLAVTRVAVPCGGTRGVAWNGARAVYVSCPNDDRVVVLDVPSRLVLSVLDVPGRPTALAIAGDRLAITSSRTGIVQTVSLSHLSPISSGPVDTAVVEALPLETTAGFAASQADALTASDDARSFVVAFQRVDHDGDRTLPADQGGYGSVVDGNPRIEPRLLSPCGGRYAQFDGSVRASSGPSAVALVAGVLWVANEYTDTVLALSCTASGNTTLASENAVAAAQPALLGAFRTGRGPRGLAVSADGRSAWVDIGFDHAVARLSLDDVTDPTAATAAHLAVTRPPGTTTMSDAALRGRGIFHDAVDTHLTPSGILTCATCHPRGGDDGLSWFLHTTHVGPKFRRTPAAWGARAALTPFHWDGAFTDAAMLSQTTIVELMNGDGLLVDTDAIATYMSELPLPPPLPLAGEDAASAARGALLFASTGCATCHSGPLFTDQMFHSVIPPTSDADATLTMVDTPSLVGIRARAPYFHDGRAATLADTLDDSGAHGHTATLSPAQLADLVMYLRSL